MKFRKRPIVVEATQWQRNGDHPLDDCTFILPDLTIEPGAVPFLSEGKVVRYYRNPNVPGGAVCTQCKRVMFVHGWIDTFEGGHIVCPGDWVITGIKGERYAVKPDIFHVLYEEVE